MTSPLLIRRLFEHLRWVNHRLLNVCRPLDAEQLTRSFDIGQGTVLATITHLYAAEFVWLEAIEGNPAPISPFDIHFESLDKLDAAWELVELRWDRLMSILSEAELDRSIVKKSTSSYAGSVRSASLADVLLHVTTHAQYTAAQLKNMLRHLGVQPLPDVMLITMSREQAARSES